MLYVFVLVIYIIENIHTVIRFMLSMMELELCDRLLLPIKATTHLLGR